MKSGKAKETCTDDALLKARFLDIIRFYDKTGKSGFLGFLDERQTMLLSQFASSAGIGRIVFWGGFPQAERTFAGIFAPCEEASYETFPIEKLTFTFRQQDRLSHRDFLGALMSAGIRRDTVGDILIEDGRCVVFVKKDIVDFVIENIKRVGGSGVKSEKGAVKPYPKGAAFSEIISTVASPRMDCIIAVLMGKGREKASEMILSGGVALFGEECTDISKRIQENTKISIRGYGKYIVDQLGPQTKKGRFSFKGRKYI